MEALEPSNAELVEQFVVVAHAVRQRANARMIAGGLSLARARVVRVLMASDAPMRMNALSAALDVAPRTITSMIDSLEKEGLVKRVADRTDRRATLLELTKQGRYQFEQLRSLSVHTDAAGIFDALKPAEKRQLVKLLTRLQAAVDSDPSVRSAGTNQH